MPSLLIIRQKFYFTSKYVFSALSFLTFCMFKCQNVKYLVSFLNFFIIYDNQMVLNSKDNKINWIGLIINLLVMVILGYLLLNWFNI